MLRAALLLSVTGMLVAGQSSQRQVQLSDLIKQWRNDRDRPQYNYQANDYFEDGDLETPGEVIMTRVRKGAGNCYAKGKCVYYSKRLKADFCGDCGRRHGCFPGDSTVLKDTGDTISMAELRVDDRVLAATRTGQLSFSPVVSWLDKRANHTAQYLRVATASGHRVTLSSSHVMLVRQHGRLVSRFAGAVLKGDQLKVADSLESEQWSPVVSIDPTISTGAYVPMTAHGTIVVDGVLASCYASFDHDWVHALTTPLRWLPALFEDHVDRNADGPRAAVEALKQFGEWLFPKPGCDQRAAIDDSVILLPLAASTSSP